MIRRSHTILHPAVCNYLLKAQLITVNNDSLANVAKRLEDTCDHCFHLEGNFLTEGNIAFWKEK